jgi:hypothetical protein
MSAWPTPWLTLRVLVSGRGVAVGKLAVLMSCGGVLLRFVVLAEIVMVRDGVMMSGSVMMTLARRMLGRFGPVF